MCRNVGWKGGERNNGEDNGVRKVGCDKEERVELVNVTVKLYWHLQ